MRTQFQLKLLGSQPMAAASVGTIISRAADVCVYVGRADDLELQVLVSRVQSGSLEILYLLADQARDGNAVAQLAFELLVADIVAAFSVMRLATGPDGASRS